MAKNNLIPAFVLFILCSCQSTLMTRPLYESIQVGTPVREVYQKAGDPYTITNEPDGTQSYRYIERIETGPGQVSQNNYILVVSEGQVVDKRLKQNDASIVYRTP